MPLPAKHTHAAAAAPVLTSCLAADKPFSLSQHGRLSSKPAAKPRDWRVRLLIYLVYLAACLAGGRLIMQYGEPCNSSSISAARFCNADAVSCVQPRQRWSCASSARAPAASWPMGT